MKKHHHIYHSTGPKPLPPHHYFSPAQLAYNTVFVRPALPCPPAMTPPPAPPAPGGGQ